LITVTNQMLNVLQNNNKNQQKVEEVKAMFIYIADRKATAHNSRFFCSACFQLLSTTTGTLLLIRRPQRVSGRVDHRHLHTRTHLVVQGVRTLCQWSSLHKAGTIWRSYCHVLDLSQPTRANFQANTPTAFRHIAPGWGRSATNQRQGQTNSEGCHSTEAFSH